MTFVCGGAAAQAAIDTTHFDAVVSDMRMPGVDGEAVLKHAFARSPHTVRIVLSGQTDTAAARRLIHVAHQFLAKPCDGDELVRCIQRCLALASLLDDPALRAVVGGLGQVPTCPAMFARLTELLSAPDVGLDAIAECIESDPAVGAKVLHVARSGFFAQRQPVTSIARAVTLLGTEIVKGIVLSAEVFQSAKAGARAEAFMAHSLATARILRHSTRSSEAFCCGVLHELGELVLLHRFGRDHEALLDEGAGDPARIAALECARYGVGHGRVGAYLLGLWGILPAFVEAIASQDSPGEPDELSAALRSACALARRAATLEEPLEPPILGSRPQGTAC